MAACNRACSEGHREGLPDKWQGHEGSSEGVVMEEEMFPYMGSMNSYILYTHFNTIHIFSLF